MEDENESGGFQLALIGCPLALALALVALILALVVGFAIAGFIG
jgi:hypothetical protein